MIETSTILIEIVDDAIVTGLVSTIDARTSYDRLIMHMVERCGEKCLQKNLETVMAENGQRALVPLSTRPTFEA